MWSLPDINRINEQAALNANKYEQAVETGVLDGEPIKCEYCDEKADTLHLWFDIFSDDPKGILGLCEQHDGYYGSPVEGFFTCDDCSNVFVENYTWERYCASTDDGIFCLNCYAKREIANPDNWIQLTEDSIDALSFAQVRQAKHLRAVGQDLPDGLQFVENVELDSSTGGRLTSTMTCESTADGGIDALKSILSDLQAKGHKRAILILDAAYQFAFSIGVYVDTPKTGGTTLE